ncbi:MAG: hypothetical protein ACOCSF_01640 [Halanaeroarchaeum sp.]
MYDESFDTDWTSLAREQAMFRAYAIGVDAALGVDHPEEVERLARETSRPLVQLAYDEGKSVAEERLQSGRGGADVDQYRGPDGARRLWDELVETRREDESSFEMVRVERRQTDLPSALSRPEFLDRPDADVAAVRLPKFLLE